MPAVLRISHRARRTAHLGWAPARRSLRDPRSPHSLASRSETVVISGRGREAARHTAPPAATLADRWTGSSVRQRRRTRACDLVVSGVVRAHEPAGPARGPPFREQGTVHRSGGASLVGPAMLGYVYRRYVTIRVDIEDNAFAPARSSTVQRDPRDPGRRRIPQGGLGVARISHWRVRSSRASSSGDRTSTSGRAIGVASQGSVTSTFGNGSGAGRAPVRRRSREQGASVRLRRARNPHHGDGSSASSSVGLQRHRLAEAIPVSQPLRRSSIE